MQEIILDGRRMTDRESAHRELAQQMNFPPYYGKNLDALWDQLTACGEQSVALTGADAMLSALGSYGCRLLQTFFEATEQNPMLHFTIRAD